MVGPATPEDETWFKSASWPRASGCNLTGAELANQNNRRCSNICSNTACRLGGFSVRMLQAAAQVGGFTFTLDAMPSLDKAGNIATNPDLISHTYTAKNSLKPNGPCDLWVSPFFITKSRLQLNFSFSAPIIPAHLQLVRRSVTQQLAVVDSPVIEGFQFYTTKVFSIWVWVILLVLYLFTRIMIYILELNRAGGETWVAYRKYKFISVPKIAIQVATHTYKQHRNMSAHIAGLFVIFMCVIAILYEAKMTDVLLTSHRHSEHKITNAEQCLVKDACCYSVELFDSILSDADARYRGMLKPIYGGEKQLWQEVASGNCLAGLTTSMRLAKAYRSNAALCGSLEAIPSTNGLLSHFEAVPFTSAWAVNQNSPNAQNIINLVNKGLGGMYGYSQADRSFSIFGIYNQYFEKTSTCVTEQLASQIKSSEMALPVATFAIPILIIFLMLLCSFFVACCRCLPKELSVDDSGDEHEQEAYLLEDGEESISS